MTPVVDASPQVLVVDDDPRLRALLQRFLTDNGMQVATAADATQARQLLASLDFDVVVLDIMMPGEDGLSLTPYIREATGIPVLLLSAKGATEDRIEGLARGADDYLAKPFEPRELVLRLQAILRRVDQATSAATATAAAAAASAGTTARAQDRVTRAMTRDDLRYDPATNRLRRADVDVPLSTLEQHLLRVLATRPGEPFDRLEIARDFGGELSERAVDVCVTRLRKKIERDPRAPRFLQTVRGAGYLLVVDA